MNRKLITTAAIAALLAGGAGLLVGRATTPTPSASAEDAEGSEAEEGEEAGEGAEGTEGDPLAIDETRLRASGIRLARATQEVLGAEIVAPATVTAGPQGAAVLTARVEGSVAAIDKRLGDPVARGERLAVVESREAGTIAAERSAATARLQLAEANYARERRLFEAKITARADLEASRAALEEARAEAVRTRAAAQAAGVSADGRTIAVRSPIAGRVTAAPATLGAYVSAEDELFRVANASTLQIEAQVPLSDARRIAPGDAARIEVAGTELAARVRGVAPALDPSTRTATVLLALGGSEGELRPGAFVRVRITPASARGTSTAVVPADAVQSVGGRDAVFVRKGERFEMRPVVLGARAGDRVAIISGLEAGETVATENAFLLKAELEKPEEEE